jgi:hypothetical protein
MSIGTCSVFPGLLTHGYRTNGLKYERRRFIINRVWQRRGDCLIETYLLHSTENDIINGAVVPSKRTIPSDSISIDKRLYSKLPGQLPGSLFGLDEAPGEDHVLICRIGT